MTGRFETFHAKKLLPFRELTQTWAVYLYNITTTTTTATTLWPGKHICSHQALWQEKTDRILR